LLLLLSCKVVFVAKVRVKRALTRPFQLHVSIFFKMLSGLDRAITSLDS